MSTGPTAAFGLSLRSEFELPGLQTSEEAGPEVSVRMVDPADLAGHAGPGGQLLWATVMDDAQPVRLEYRPGMGYVFEYGRRATFLISVERDVVLCAPTDPEDPSWRRFLLDTVLFTTSLLNGFEALHGSCVAAEAGVLLFLAPTGGGKTSLALELLSRGASLFADDVVALGRTPSGMLAHPGPALMNVPSAGGLVPHPAGCALASLGDELWFEVERPPVTPQRPAAIFLLDRRLGAEEEVVRLEANSLPLLPHSLGIESTADRTRRRFELLADLVLEVPIFRLQADMSATPGALADLVERRLGLSTSSPVPVSA